MLPIVKIVSLAWPWIRHALFGKFNLYGYFLRNKFTGALTIFQISLFIAVLIMLDQAYYNSKELASTIKALKLERERVATLEAAVKKPVIKVEKVYVDRECPSAPQPTPLEKPKAIAERRIKTTPSQPQKPPSLDKDSFLDDLSALEDIR